MTLQINRSLTVRQDEADANAITVFQLVGCNGIASGWRTSIVSALQRYRLALMVAVYTIDSDMAERGRSSDTAGIADQGTKRCVTRLNLVDRRPLYRTGDRHLRAGRRHEQSIPTFEVSASVADTVQQKVIQIDIFDQLWPPIMACDAERTHGCRSTSRIKRTQWRCE